MKKFTRVVITSINTDYALQKPENHRCKDAVEDLVIYNNMVCGLIHLAFKYIPETYKTVIEDQDLAKLTIEHWIGALIRLNMPIASIDTVSADNPPKDPGGISIHSLVDEILKDMTKDMVSKVEQITEKTRREIINLLEPHELQKIIEELRRRSISKAERQELMLSLS